jgi:chemotaxis protein MotB
MEKRFTNDLFSFEQTDNAVPRGGMHDWAVPWSDLMMVMFVLFVVLFIYASSHQDVKVLFSRSSAEKAQASSTLDPLIGLIGQISSRVDGQGGRDVVTVADHQVVYRSRSDGVTVVREGGGRVRVTLRGALFFDAAGSQLKDGSEQYLQEIAESVRLSVGLVHVIGYASPDEAIDGKGFSLSSGRAAGVAEFLINGFGIDPKRIVITGRGAYHPELPDTSKENQALNRRVEIVITNKL